MAPARTRLALLEALGLAYVAALLFHPPATALLIPLIALVVAGQGIRAWMRRHRPGATVGVTLAELCSAAFVPSALLLGGALDPALTGVLLACMALGLGVALLAAHERRQLRGYAKAHPEDWKRRFGAPR